MPHTLQRISYTQENGKKRERQCYYRIQYRGPCHGPAQLHGVMGPEGSCDQKRKTHVHSLRDIHNDLKDRPGGTYGRKRAVTEIIAGDRRIDDIVSLLQKISDQDGKHKPQQKRRRISLRHVE